MKKKKKKDASSTKAEPKGEAEASAPDAVEDTLGQTQQSQADDNAIADDKATEDDKPAEEPKVEEEAQAEEEPKAEEESLEKAVDSPPSSDTPSLAQQSKLRSTSFRAGSIVGPGPMSPGPFSPEGDTAPDIYRKHVARIEELEKENKRLAKDATDSEKRWKKAEEELADLRESDGKESKDGQTEKLVCGTERKNHHRLYAQRFTYLLTGVVEGGDCVSTAPKLSTTTASVPHLWPRTSTISVNKLSPSITPS